MYKSDDIWKQLQLFHSAETTQSFLSSCYQKVDIDEPDVKSYDNCYPFMYYLEQGEIFFQQAASAPLSIKPVLLFYGIVHLIKACLLTVDPLYPSSTSVLAHGVTTRKRKKRQYEFFHDEIKVQKNGLCTYFSEQMFHVKQLEGEKFKMGELLSLVAELDDAFAFIKGKSNIIMLQKEINHVWKIPDEVHESYYMDANRLKRYINEKYIGLLQWHQSDPQLFTYTNKSMIQPPFRYHAFKQRLCTPATLQPYNDLPDMIVHYLLLYNLSMICRYETEWWFELLKTTPNADHPFIKSYLNIAEKKVPLLIEDYLMEKLSGR